jgi:hypothetical protein
MGPPLLRDHVPRSGSKNWGIQMVGVGNSLGRDEGELFQLNHSGPGRRVRKGLRRKQKFSLILGYRG